MSGKITVTNVWIAFQKLWSYDRMQATRELCVRHLRVSKGRCSVREMCTDSQDAEDAIREFDGKEFMGES
jgi:hypothetical protein